MSVMIWGRYAPHIARVTNIGCSWDVLFVCGHMRHVSSEEARRLHGLRVFPFCTECSGADARDIDEINRLQREVNRLESERIERWLPSYIPYHMSWAWLNEGIDTLRAKLRKLS